MIKESDEEFDKEEVDEQMMMQEQEKECTETAVSSNACECQCCIDLNVSHHPVDASRSVFSLNYSASARQKKHNRKIQTTWYKRYTWITVCTSTYRIFCVMCHSAYRQGLLSTPSKHSKLTFCTTGFNAWGKALEQLGQHEKSEMHKESVIKSQAKSNFSHII